MTKKGRDVFTRCEVENLKKLINQKIQASTSEQKAIRKRIRDIGFYFSDFSGKKGYTLDDFQILIDSGIIRISENLIEPKSNRFKNGILKESPGCATVEYVTEIEKNLINGKFVLIKDLDWNSQNHTGLYCLRLAHNSELPSRYQTILNRRVHKYIYLGKAEGQFLNKRLEQELENRGHGTFFRSIGAVLGYLPINGHLRGKANKRNYKFSADHKKLIIEWLKNNVEISTIKHSGDFAVEEQLIKKYCPLLNDVHNPQRLTELREDKKKCRAIACGIEKK